MTAQLRLFFAAVQYFTRLPVPASVGHSQQLLNDAARYFPAVGLLVALLVAASLWVGSLLWPPWVAAGVAVAVGIWLTGAFHEDGLADAFDGLGGGFDRERTLAIMRDSRIGTYGAVALGLTLLLRVAVLASLPVDAACVLLVVGHVVSRAASVWLMRRLPYVREDESRAKPLVQTVSRTSVGIASLLAAGAVAAGAAVQPAVLPGVLAMLPGAWFWARLLRRRLGGYTGDCLGASQQLTELLCYLGFLAAWSI
jgi:adenosylcobinamide-GDP ribazoletransferase